MYEEQTDSKLLQCEKMTPSTKQSKMCPVNSYVMIAASRSPLCVTINKTS